MRFVCWSAPAGVLRRGWSVWCRVGQVVGVVGRWPVLMAAMKVVQAVWLKARVGPWGSLLSRTGTTPVNPGATSTQSPPLAPLYVLLTHIAAPRSGEFMVAVPFHDFGD